MLRSLWFRLTGTVFLVVVVTMVVALVASLVIMRREFVEFVNAALANVQTSLAEPGSPGALDLEQVLPRDMPGLRFVNPVTGEERDLPALSVRVPQIVQDEATDFLITMRNSLLTAIAISGGLAIVASTWLFWQITRPLAKLRGAAEAVAAGDLEARVPVTSKDEVGRVAQSFNEMAAQLARQEQLRQQMVADVAHELRTPLSVMRGNLEAMLDDLIPASPEELEAVHEEVLRLAQLVEDLRVLSLADAGDLRLVPERLDVGGMVEAAVRRMSPLAQAKGVALIGDISQAEGAIMGDEGKLQQVLANLTDNAIRYTPAGGTVTIEARTDGREARLLVRDQGPGVDPADLANLFERLWKGDRARSRTGSGSGLGLSIVRQLVTLHGGTVQASLPTGGGLQVTVTLPLAQATAPIASDSGRKLK